MSLPRFELKFRINEATASVVREYARAHVEPDPFANPITRSYQIDSLYLDSDDLKTFWSTVNGSRRRYKLRVRTYDERPTAPVFFEVKRCIDDMIVKERGAVHRSAVEKILAGWLPDAEDMISSDPDHFLAVENFVRLMQQIEAKPKVFVRYIREAWIGRDDRRIRFTMDRDVGVAPKSTSDFRAELDDPKRPFGNNVVLELKFSGNMPSWFPDLARIAGLRITPAAKYCDGIKMHNQNEFSPIDWPTADPAQLFDDQPEAAVLANGDPSGQVTAPLSFLEEIREHSKTRVKARFDHGATATEEVDHSQAA